ncbi:MAG: 5-deoxy-glucuronate isomerase, partial [Nocardioidaceae bacterium]
MTSVDGQHDDPHVVRHGRAASGPFALEITPEGAGWSHCGLQVLELEPGGAETIRTGDSEVVVLSLSGGAHVSVDDTTYTLVGRAGVFDGPSDVVYAPRDSTLTVDSERGGRFALCSARCSRRLAPAYLPRDEVPVELRGAGQA